MKSFTQLPFCKIPSVSSAELALPRLIRRELSRLRCHGHILLLFSRKENSSSCSACGHLLQDLTISSWIVPHLSLSGALSLALLLPFLTSGADLGMWPDCRVSVEFLHSPIPRKGSGSATITPPSEIFLLRLPTLPKIS